MQGTFRANAQETKTATEKKSTDKKPVSDAEARAAESNAQPAEIRASKTPTSENTMSTGVTGNNTVADRKVSEEANAADDKAVSMENNAASGGMSASNGGNLKSNMPDLKSWPMAGQMAAKEMTDKYGQPDGVTAEKLYWKDKGQWKKISVSKDESVHIFPVAHTDMLTQCISYKVPLDKYDDLAKFDGSVTVDRTQGTLSARCDKEANNLLALNLAHDIIMGKRTVEQARSDFAKIVQEKMKGGNPEYMQRLMFKPATDAADTDVNTTGLDKDGKKVSTPKAAAN